MKRKLVINIGQLVTAKGNTAQFGKKMNQLQIINCSAVYIEDGIIQMVGTEDEVLASLKDLKNIEIIDAESKAVIPGFVDSHTHFVFGGYREDEFINRIEGVEYLELLKQGGGIQTTVQATKGMDKEQLIQLGNMRVQEMLAQGVTTMEGKSGYGLDRECELKQLEVMKKINEMSAVDLVSTYLGAHAVPLEYKENVDEYLDFMIKEIMPYIKENKLAEYVDVFCEDEVFSINESRKLLTAAKNMGFKTKIHADEIVELGGAELAAEVGTQSADHLLMISDEGILKLCEKKVVATLLPNTAFCLAKPYAPARKLIDSGAAVALASDYNPGSCFSNSIPLMLSLAVIHMHMTLEEALTALTINGAAALGRAETIGTIEIGKKADLLILDYESYKFLVYHTGANIVKKVIKSGEIVYENK